MKEIADIVVNNGIGMACVIYLIYFQSTTMKEMLNTLSLINERLSVIETKVGVTTK